MKINKGIESMGDPRLEVRAVLHESETGPYTVSELTSGLRFSLIDLERRLGVEVDKIEGVTSLTAVEWSVSRAGTEIGVLYNEYGELETVGFMPLGLIESLSWPVKNQALGLTAMAQEMREQGREYYFTIYPAIPRLIILETIAGQSEARAKAETIELGEGQPKKLLLNGEAVGAIRLDLDEDEVSLVLMDLAGNWGRFTVGRYFGVERLRRGLGKNEFKELVSGLLKMNLEVERREESLPALEIIGRKKQDSR